MALYYTDDPVMDYECYESDLQDELDKLPKCCQCGEPIQQDRAVCFNDEYICDSCLDDLRVEILL